MFRKTLNTRHSNLHNALLSKSGDSIPFLLSGIKAILSIRKSCNCVVHLNLSCMISRSLRSSDRLETPTETFTPNKCRSKFKDLSIYMFKSMPITTCHSAELTARLWFHLILWGGHIYDFARTCSCK